MSKNKIAGIVLAGGQSKRFGSPKAFATKMGKPFYQYSLDALHPYVDEIVLVTNENLYSTFAQCIMEKVVIDENQFQGKGPMTGLYTGMKAIEAEWYFVLPIDVPFVQPSVISALIEQIDPVFDMIMPTVNGRNQPLIALYNQSMKKLLYQNLMENNTALRKLLHQANVKFIKRTDVTSFININYSHDYEKWILEKRSDLYGNNQ